MKSSKIILIGGMPRSGTTLVSNYIQNQLNIPISPETHFFDCAVDDKNYLSIDRIPFEVMEDPKLGDIYRSVDGLQIKDKIQTFELILDAVFGTKFLVYGEKTPAHMMYFRELIGKRNNYSFIIVQRSCLDVCNSLRNVPWNDGCIIKNALRWSKYYIESKKLLKDYPNRVLIVEYEELCRLPEENIRVIRKFLNIDKLNQKNSEFSNFSENSEPWKKGASQAPMLKKDREYVINKPIRLLLRLLDRSLRVLY